MSAAQSPRARPLPNFVTRLRRHLEDPMKPAFLLVVASSLLLAACSGTKKSEIEGSWTAVSAEKDPKLTRGPTKDQFAHTKFTFTGTQFTLENEERKAEGTLKVDASRTPKEIDLLGRQTMKGIYKVE